jgi:hypothetical protein
MTDVKEIMGAYDFVCKNDKYIFYFFYYLSRSIQQENIRKIISYDVLTKL